MSLERMLEIPKDSGVRGTYLQYVLAGYSQAEWPFGSADMAVNTAEELKFHIGGLEMDDMHKEALFRDVDSARDSIIARFEP